MREAFSVLVVEPNSLSREGLCRILRAAHLRVVNAVPSIDPEFLDSAADHANLLLVISAGNDDHGVVGQIELFKRKCASGRVAVVADCSRPSDVLAAFRSGANAYFLQSMTCDILVRSLDLVMRGQTLVPAEILALLLHQEQRAPSPIALLERDASADLSALEKRVLEYLAEGYSNKMIARKIDIAEAMVKAHIKVILRKIQVQNRTQAAIWAKRIVH
jgi:two-component system nitrate/nitrite response regulator NarL